jgi:hypothetical protein
MAYQDAGLANVLANTPSAPPAGLPLVAPSSLPPGLPPGPAGTGQSLAYTPPANVLAQPMSDAGGAVATPPPAPFGTPEAAAEYAAGPSGRSGIVNHRTGLAPRDITGKDSQSVLLASLAKQHEAKVAANTGAYAPPEPPSFVDWVKTYAAPHSGDTPVDPTTMSDKQIMQYADDYGQSVVAGDIRAQLLAAGLKPDKDFIAGKVQEFKYGIASALPQVHTAFAPTSTAPSAPGAAAPPDTDGLGEGLGNAAKELGGNVLEGIGNTLGGVVRNLPTLANSLSPMGAVSAGVQNALETPQQTQQRQAAQAQESSWTAPIADAVTHAIAGTGKNVLASESPGYQAAANQPLLKPGENFFSTDGSVNAKVFNGAAFNLPSLTRKLGAPIAQFAPALAASLLTKSPLPLMGAAGAMTSEQLQQAETERLGAFTPEQWNQTPAYVAKIVQGVNPDAAKQQVIDESAAMQQKIGLVGGAAMGAAAELPFFKPAAGGLLKTIATNYTKQAPLFAGLAAGQQAASTAGANLATGEQRDVLAGTGEAAAQAALGAAPFSVLGHGQAAEGKPTPKPTPKGEEAPPIVPGAPAAATPGSALDVAFKQALTDVPVPVAPAPVADPAVNAANAAKHQVALEAHYEGAKAAFMGELSQDETVTPEQQAAAPAAFDAQWKAATGQPTPDEARAAAVAPAADATTPLPPDATPDELATAAATAPGEAFPLPEGITQRVGAELTKTLGREPTPEEIATEGNSILTAALAQEGIDRTLPREALEEAVGDLVQGKTELPDAAAINAKARGDVLAKKDEPVAADAAAGEGAHFSKEELNIHGTHDLLASDAEAGKYAANENFLKRFSNAHDALAALLKPLANTHLGSAIKTLLSNPEIVKGLKETALKIVNPGDADRNRTHTSASIGVFHDGKTATATWGAYSPKDKTAYLAGSKWRPGAADSGMHPITIVHEAVHVALSHLVEGVEKGTITDPKLVDAYGQLESIRKTLQDRLSDITQAKPGEQQFTKYALKDVHELLSVTFTDPRVREVMRNIRVGKVTLWQRLVGAYNKLLGNVHPDTTVLDHVLSLGKTFIDHQGNTAAAAGDAHLSRMSDRMEARSTDELIEASNIKARPEVTAQQVASDPIAATTGTADKAATNFYNSLASLRKLQEWIHKTTGRTIAAGSNVFDAATRFQVLRQHAVQMAQVGHVDPMFNAIAETAKSLGKSSVDFFNALDKYYRGKDALERNAFFELKEGRLTQAFNEKRQALTEAWGRGELPDGQYRARLEALSAEPGARVQNRTPLNASGLTDAQARGFLAYARKNGIAPDVIARFDPIVQQLRDADASYNQAANKFSAADEARRTGMGLRDYLPNRGFADEENAPLGGKGEPFSSQYTMMTGREDQAQSGLLSLMQNTLRSARGVEENKLTGVLWKFARQNPEAGIKIHLLPNEKNIQAAIAAGKDLSSVQKLAAGPNVIIHNAGEFRYAIEFKPDDPSLKALKGIGQKEDFGIATGALNVAGKASNFIGRGLTVLQPSFSLYTAIIRDFLYNPTLSALDHGVGATAEYVKQYLGNGGPLGAWHYYFKSPLHARNVAERAAFAAEHNSGFGHSMEDIVKYGGDVSFAQQLNNKTYTEADLHKSLLTLDNPLTGLKRKGQAVVNYMDQVATIAIMASRRAAFEAYVKTGMKKIGGDATPKQIEQLRADGALYARRLLDYQQTSHYGQALNSLKMFSRVALTHGDRIMASFRNADGSYDYAKMAKTSVALMGMGFAYYAFARNASTNMQKQQVDSFANSLPIPLPNGKVFQLPAPYGIWRLGITPGILAARAFYGDNSVEDSANMVRNMVLENLTPLKLPAAQHNEKIGDSVLDFVQAGVPTILSPAFDLARNNNAFGQQIITKKQMDAKGPLSDRGKPGTSESLKMLAQDLSHIGIDMYPESLAYVMSAYGAGPMTNLLRVAKDTESVAAGKEVDREPFMPRIYSEDAKYYQMNKTSETMEDLKNLRNPTPEQQQLYKAFEISNSKYGKQISSVNRNKLLSASSRAAQIDAIRQKENSEQAKLVDRARKTL